MDILDDAKDASDETPATASWVPRTVAFGLLLTALSLAFFPYVIDDAYITSRYASNLVRFGELTWNRGEDPVEGFTSMAWVLLQAMVIRLGGDPIMAAKVVSLVAAIVLVAMISWVGRRARGLPITVALATLAASPAFAVLTIQGLETALATLCIAATAYALIAARSRPSSWRFTMFYALAFAGALVRPDTLLPTAFFGAFLFVGLRARRRELIAALATWAPFVVAGVAYMAWRYAYFGYLLPNTAYVKGGADIEASGLRQVITFLCFPALPAVLTLGVLWKRSDAGARRRVMPLLIASAAYMAYGCTIVALQGYLWRFLYPGLAPALLAIAVLADETHVLAPSASPWRTRALMVGAIGWQLLATPYARREVVSRTENDREAAGRALRGLDGTMLVTESGAVPYFSDWRAVDVIGLNSEPVAHRGLTSAFLASLDPDVVLIYSPGPYVPERWPVLNRYLVDRGFEVATVLRKHGAVLHVWLVRPDSPLAPEVVRRLRDLPDVRYADLATALSQAPAFTAYQVP